MQRLPAREKYRPKLNPRRALIAPAADSFFAFGPAPGLQALAPGELQVQREIEHCRQETAALSSRSLIIEAPPNTNFGRAHER